MNWKDAARVCLHSMGGLTVLRRMRRRESRLLMFHAFRASDEENIEAICSHIAGRFEPVSLSKIVDSMGGGRSLPDNALSVTVDDGYRNYLEYAHPIFRRHRIPVTMYSVADFADGRMWLWTDWIEYCLERTTRNSLRVEIEGFSAKDLAVASSAERALATGELWEALKIVPDAARMRFLMRLSELTGVEIPGEPPDRYAAMNWDELRAAAADGVEIGCHTRTHPILSRVDAAALENEIRGAKQFMEERLGFPVVHFCYPNGRDIDIGPAAIECVGRCGFRSAVTTTWGLNTPETDPLLLRRVPLAADIAPDYAFELLAGLHMPRRFPEAKEPLAA